MLAEEKLRKISELVFQEANLPQDGKRPLEWRRDFNYLSFRLKNLKLVTSCTVHDKNIVLRSDQTENFFHSLKPDVADHLMIAGDIDEEEMRDRLYVAVADKDDKTLYSTSRAPRPLKASIKAGIPSEASDKSPAGLYWGVAIPLDFDPRDQGYLFELSIPKEQLQRIVSAIPPDLNAALELQVQLLSYTYEVDDFLREWWHPRDIVVNDTAPCFVRWVGVTSKIGFHNIPDNPRTEEREPQRGEEREISPHQRAHAERMHLLLSNTKSLKSAVAALWILAVVGLLILFFK